jgi:hypothetical protein
MMRRVFAAERQPSTDTVVGRPVRAGHRQGGDDCRGAARGRAGSCRVALVRAHADLAERRDAGSGGRPQRHTAFAITSALMSQDAAQRRGAASRTAFRTSLGRTSRPLRLSLHAGSPIAQHPCAEIHRVRCHDVPPRAQEYHVAVLHIKGKPRASLCPGATRYAARTERTTAQPFAWSRDAVTANFLRSSRYCSVFLLEASRSVRGTSCHRPTF